MARAALDEALIGVAVGLDAIDLTCDASRAALLSKYGLAYNRTLDLDPATVRIKLVVRSVRTGAAGTVNLPVLK